MSFSSFVIPLVILFIFCYGIYKNVDVFDEFVAGAKEGVTTTINVLPALIAIMTAIGMFKASGALDVLTNALEPLASLLQMPKEITPLMILRPISGSGALAFVEDILKNHGPDSMAGRIASVIMGSTETTFYTIAVYYSAAEIRKIRYTVPCSLTADCVGFIMSTVLVRIFFPI
ncbi:spore maturation protein [Acetanaerobacterium elongatum]|uniref:Spore maturation protein B n=1 Tax=Acetanaerobacterium elongatum TaxID=258515 RepID=A0A1H0GYX9_9FIRM|nr:nucleoside recognition domain-containing protein [Acetanaerobacterium elongatum]SDO12070.1 spore maturation protein B [Acetanaerobacterium elongatum]